MKYLIFGSVIIGALVIGFFLGRMTNNVQDLDNVVTDRTIIRDTVIKEKTIQIIQPIENNEVVDAIPSDSMTTLKDSLLLLSELADTTGEFTISREILIKSENLAISYLNEEVPAVDSTLKENLGIKPNKNKYISVEYWQSPLNYEGYKLSKGKLILYGVPAQFKFEFVKNGNRSYIASDEISYSLQESEEFKPLKIVASSEVYAD